MGTNGWGKAYSALKTILILPYNKLIGGGERKGEGTTAFKDKLVYIKEDERELSNMEFYKLLIKEPTAQ